MLRDVALGVLIVVIVIVLFYWLFMTPVELAA